MFSVKSIPPLIRLTLVSVIYSTYRLFFIDFGLREHKIKTIYNQFDFSNEDLWLEGLVCICVRLGLEYKKYK